MIHFKRNCPKCKKELFYSRKTYLEKADLKQSLCKDCRKARTWERECPDCKKKLVYKTKAHCSNAEKIKSKCLSCSKKYCYIGDKNPFYGKKHTFETKQKIKNCLIGTVKNSDVLQKMSENMIGMNNPMFGKSVYDLWIIKYGTEEANNRMNLLREKRSLNASGKNNPMYGKPSPQGSGNGWSGWYNDFFFRSLKELSYIILELEKKKLKWKTAEKIKIQYVDWNGKERTYRPDFIVNENKIIEVKPIKLHVSPLVKLKCDAASKYCFENNLTFQIVDTKMLSFDEIKELRISNKIKFTKKYEERFVNYGQNCSFC